MTAPAPRTVPDTRFTCGGCTACCRSFALGPVEPAVIARLDALGIRDAWGPARGGFAVRRPGPDGRPAWFLTRRDDGGCVFLRDDGLCAVHALHGADAKPAFCREYPFMVVEDAAAPPTVVVRGDCGGWAESFEHGEPVDAQAADILGLPRAYPPARLQLDPVPILPGIGVGAHQIDAVDAALAGPLRAPRGAAAAAAEAGDALWALVRRGPPPRDPARAEAALRAATHRLRTILAAALAAAPPDDPEIRGMVAALRAAATLLQAAGELPDRPLAPSAGAYLGLVLSNELAGRQFQPWGGVPPWLGGMVLGARLATGAAPGDGAVDARSFGAGLATWIRFTRHPAAQRALAELRPALVDIFLHSAPERGP